MPTQTIITENQAKMKKTVEALQNSLKSLRTGRASTGLVQNIKVEYYGLGRPCEQGGGLDRPGWAEYNDEAGPKLLGHRVLPFRGLGCGPCIPS